MSDLRERIARALPMGTAFSDGSTAEEVADAVLDALGLEQVGWCNEGGVHDLLDGLDLTPDVCADTGCVPVYRLGGSHE